LYAAEGTVTINVASPLVPPVVAFDHVSLAFDDNVVLREISFAVNRGEMKILLGASGSGKSVVLKLILGLLRPDSGIIRLDGRRIDHATEAELRTLRAGIGMLFQESALFDSLSVGDNVGYRLAEETETPPDEVRRRVEEVLAVIGLEEYIDQMPSELSGGQRRRVAIGRAIAHKPRLLLIDEPTSGLDPITARTIDDLVIRLRDFENVTCVAVTHQLRDAFYVATHQAVRRDGTFAIVPLEDDNAAKAEFVMLKDGRVYFDGTAARLRESADPYLKRFLADPARNLAAEAA
jgi:phospholipid/cholesterol/gamma-HCH transport system ATP-binding protein